MAYTASVMTNRLQDLKQNFLKAVPSITIGRAIAFTEVAKEFPDIPRNLRRARIPAGVRDGAASDPGRGTDRRSSVRQTSGRSLLSGYCLGVGAGRAEHHRDSSPGSILHQ